jgi:hypothetical protein
VVEVRKHFLSRAFRVAAAVALLAAAGPGGRRFYPDDPLWRMPPPLPVRYARDREISDTLDFLRNSFATPGPRQKPGHYIEAEDVNTLGEVPDSPWYTNRNYRHPMSIAELRQGPARGNQPVPPFRVVGAKTQGIAPGFVMMDSRNRRYFCKSDPKSNPEMATAADVIGSRFFYAFGYNTPENYIFYYSRSQISVAPGTRITGMNGKKRAMTVYDLDRVLEKIPRDREGRYRMMASFAIPGKGVGPFLWYGTRSDDPNDIYPHEHRRELRGLYVFCAWLNHTDIKAGNTFDTLLPIDGTPAIRHYLIDFGAIMGSDSDRPKDVSRGHEYMIELDGTVPLKVLGLGLYAPRWVRVDYGDIRAVGKFSAQAFDPNRWTPNYPNSAFLDRLPDDDFWAAKQVMAFSDADIRAIVETGEYSNPRAVDYITRVLIERRDTIGRAFFGEVLPLDRFEVSGGRLRFDDLAVKYGFSRARGYRIRWYRFDNRTGQSSPIENASGDRLPQAGQYLMARIADPAAPAQTVEVYLRGDKVVGIDRKW